MVSRPTLCLSTKIKLPQSASCVGARSKAARAPVEETSACGVSLEGACETTEPSLGVTTMVKMPILMTRSLSSAQMDGRHDFSQDEYSKPTIDPRTKNLSTDDYVHFANFQDICRYSEAAADAIQDVFNGCTPDDDTGALGASPFPSRHG